MSNVLEQSFRGVPSGNTHSIFPAPCPHVPAPSPSSFATPRRSALEASFDTDVDRPRPKNAALSTGACGPLHRLPTVRETSAVPVTEGPGDRDGECSTQGLSNLNVGAANTVVRQCASPAEIGLEGQNATSINSPACDVTAPNAEKMVAPSSLFPPPSSSFSSLRPRRSQHDVRRLLPKGEAQSSSSSSGGISPSSTLHTASTRGTADVALISVDDGAAAKARRQARESTQHSRVSSDLSSALLAGEAGTTQWPRKPQQPQPHSHPRRTSPTKSDGTTGVSFFDVTASTSATTARHGDEDTASQAVPATVGGNSVHSTLGFSMFGPTGLPLSRARDGEASTHLGSVTGNNTIISTTTSHPAAGIPTVPTAAGTTSGVRTSPGRAAPHGSSSSTGASVAGAEPSLLLLPSQATLSLLHLEADESNTGRSGHTRPLFACLPPRPRASATAASILAVPPSEEALHRAEGSSNGGRSALHSVPGSPLMERVPSTALTAAAAAVVARRSHCVTTSSNASDTMMMPGDSACNSTDIALSALCPRRPAMCGPRGRRNYNKSGAMVGSLTSVTAGPCCNGSVNAQYGVSLLLTDGTLMSTRQLHSSSSAVTGSNMGTSNGSYFTDTNTFLTIGSSANSRSTTLTSTATMLAATQRPQPQPQEERIAVPFKSGPVVELPGANGACAAPRKAADSLQVSSTSDASARSAAATETPEVSKNNSAVKEEEAEAPVRAAVEVPPPPSSPRRGSCATRIVIASVSTPPGTPSDSPLHDTSSEHAAPTTPVSTPTTATSASTEVAALTKVVKTLPAPPLSAAAAAAGPLASSPSFYRVTSPPFAAREDSESEVHHRNTIRWLTAQTPSFRSASAGSMRSSSLLLRPRPLSARSGSLANSNHCLLGAALPASSPTNSHGCGEAPHSPRSTSFAGFQPAGARCWSADASVDAPLDLCGTATLLSTDTTQKTDSAYRTDENSLTVDESNYAAGSSSNNNAPQLSSARFRQLNSFSRSRFSVSGGAGQRSSVGGNNNNNNNNCGVCGASSVAAAVSSRASSVAMLNLASVTNSALMRGAAGAAATTMTTKTTLISSTTRTTTTTTTTTPITTTPNAAAGNVAFAPTTTVTTTAVSSVTCSAVHIIAAQKSTAAREDAAETADAVGALPVNALLEDPDAPPFAKAALRRFREQDTRARDTSPSPRRAAAAAPSHASAIDAAAASCVVSTAAVQSCCTTHSFMAEARCFNRSAAPNLSSHVAPPQQAQPRPSASTALVSITRSHPEKLSCAKKAATNPLMPESPLLLSPPERDVEALSAVEVHLPTVTRKTKRFACLDFLWT